MAPIPGVKSDARGLTCLAVDPSMLYT